MGEPNVISLLNDLRVLAKKVTDADERMIILELDQVLQKDEIKKESDNVLIYLIVESALAYACRAPTKEEVLNLLIGLDITPNQRLLDLVHPFGNRAQIAYLNAIYYIMGLNLVGIKYEISVDNLVKIVRSMDIAPDIKIAEYTINTFKDFENSKNKDNEKENTLDDRSKALHFTINQLAKATYSIVETELRRSFNIVTMLEYVKKGIGSYIIALGLLAYSGRDFDNEAVSKVLIASDIKPDPALLGDLRNMHYRNYIVYLIVIYLLKAVGKEITTNKILDTAKALYIEPDIMLAQRALEFFEKSK